MKLRLMSNNQWKNDQNTPFWEERGLDCSAEVREKGFASFYIQKEPDVIGMQEISPYMLDCLMRDLKDFGFDYTAIWGRDTPILYRSDRLELVESAWLIYPRAIPGLSGEFNNYDTKSYCIAVFRERASGKMFSFMTTHLWWMSDDPASAHYQAGSGKARGYQMDIAIDQLDRYRTRYTCPQIIVGDFNTFYDSDPIHACLNRGFVHAHNCAVEFTDETNGHHPLGPSIIEPYAPTDFSQSIDHILVRDAPEGFVRRFERDMPESYLLLSDHAPVWIDVEL